MKIATYETDLTDDQWQLLRRFLPAAKKCGRPRTGLLARLNHRLRAKVRQAVDKPTQPTAASLDSQTVRASAHGGRVGYDAAKKTRGRKRFLLVDTLGLLLGVALEPADCPERKGARALLTAVLADYPELLKLWVDGGFNGPEFADWVQTQHPKLVVEVVRSLAEVPGFLRLRKFRDRFQVVFLIAVILIAGAIQSRASSKSHVSLPRFTTGCDQPLGIRNIFSWLIHLTASFWF